jgi:hypothetical protein
VGNQVRTASGLPSLARVWGMSCLLLQGAVLQLHAADMQAAEAVLADSAWRRAELASYFSGPAEPRVEKALWTSDKIFNIGIHDMGAAEHNLARQACTLLEQQGFGAAYRVRVIDINSMGDKEQDWEIIGEARCRQQD